jgi:hypothetical protein
MKKKELPIEEPKPVEPTNMEIVTALADSLKEIEECAQKHGATILNHKIEIDLNAFGFFDMQIKLCFSDVCKRLTFHDYASMPTQFSK